MTGVRRLSLMSPNIKQFCDKEKKGKFAHKLK